MLRKTPKVEPAVGEPPNGGAGGWDDLRCLRIYKIKYTERAVSISGTARHAEKGPLRINDVVILDVFPPLALRSVTSGNVFLMPRFVTLQEMTLTRSTDLLTFLLPKRIKWWVQEGHDATSLVSIFGITASSNVVTSAVHFSIPMRTSERKRFFAGRGSRSNSASLATFDTCEITISISFGPYCFVDFSSLRRKFVK